MALRSGLCAAMMATMALAACGGGSGSDGDGPTTGLPDPGDIVGADQEYLAGLEEYLAILRGPAFDDDPADLPSSGTAVYSGVGRIYDASVNTGDVTVSALRDRSVVTDVLATVDFGGGGSMTAFQDNFIDVEGKTVSGEVNWTGTYDKNGLFTATVSGVVDGTEFETNTDQAGVLFFGDDTDGGVAGLFVNARVTKSGGFKGSRISGDFAATKD